MISFIKNPEISVILSSQVTVRSDLTFDRIQGRIKFSKNEINILQELEKIIVAETEHELPKRKKMVKKNAKKISLVDLRQLMSNEKFLCDILGDYEIELPKNEIIERNPVLEERIQRLKAQQANKVYESMVRNVDSRLKQTDPTESIAFQIKQINRQLIAVAQFVFSVISGFCFGFIGIELIIGSLDFGFRLLLGIMCALIIALAEIYFLAKKLVEEEDADELEKNKDTVKASVPSKEMSKNIEKLKVN